MTVQFIYAQLDCIAHLELLKLLFKSEYTDFKHENSAISSFRFTLRELVKTTCQDMCCKIFFGRNHDL